MADCNDQDVCADLRRLYCGGSCAGGGTVAPCTFCEWCGICPQHVQEEQIELDQHDAE